MKNLRLLSKQCWDVKHFVYNQPVIFLLPFPCGIILDSKDPANSITQYDVEENLSHLMTLARLALEKGDTERAQAILQMGIKICEEYEVHVALPYMYDVLASISFALGNMSHAEHLLVSAIEKLIQLGTPEDDTQIVDFQLRLCRIYSAYNQKDLAEIGFQDCLGKQKLKILNGDTSTKTGMLYVNTLFWYGLHKIKSFDHASAKKMLTSAYDYSMKIKGLSPYQEMVILYTLSDLYMQLGENSAALQNMQSAILLGKGIGSTDLPRCYWKLAQIYINLGAWDNASESATEASRLAELFGEAVLKSEIDETLRKIKDHKK
ncbi:tetratricopeptide repeat protein 19, mitochondrial-like [Cylas formicarius]|uniref:tetratricopeptide repeat protein 19, mitochondrial-like n=1 Tax=Cylas formicarius TaxID=197179 RepID=UPI00295898D8|nr:tetratricopeptide repeat protein 19, mitochondrial-like [Cylas formicarius]